MPTATPPPVRGALYTRPSTAAGLEQACHRLDAPRDAARAYRRDRGWHAGADALDAGGCTGGHLERPARWLQGWCIGGLPPCGYASDAQAQQLVLNPGDAASVRAIWATVLETQAVTAVMPARHAQG